MVEAVAQHVAPFAAEHGGELGDAPSSHVRHGDNKLAGVHLEARATIAAASTACWINDADVTLTIDRLLGMSYRQRAENNCISVERADLVLAGCAILDAIRQAFPLPRLRVADRGLREAMLIEMMREDGVLPA